MARRETGQLFDLMIKFILQEAGDPARVALINGLFGKHFPLTTEVTFDTGETVATGKKQLKKIQSDCIMILGERAFVIEVQIRDDASIALRIFEYGLGYARRHRWNSPDGSLIVLPFPEPVIIHLEPTDRTPDQVSLRLEMPTGEYVDYVAPVYKVLDRSIEALERDTVQLLLPFYLLKHRKEVKRRGTSHKRRQELAEQTGLLIREAEAALNRGHEAGILTQADVDMLRERIVQMYGELYNSYQEFQEEQMRLEERLKTHFQERQMQLEERLKTHFQEQLKTHCQDYLDKGIQQGVQQEKVQLARKLIQKGWNPEDIIETTGLDRDIFQSL